MLNFSSEGLAGSEAKPIGFRLHRRVVKGDRTRCQLLEKCLTVRTKRSELRTVSYFFRRVEQLIMGSPL